MDKIIALLVTNPSGALTVIALFVSGFLLLAFKNRLIKDFGQFESQLHTWGTNISNHMTGTQEALTAHTSNMEKVSKVMSEDLFKMKENVFAVKQELIDRIDKISTLARQLEHDGKSASNSLKQTTERFEERFGRITEMRGEIEALHDRLTSVENDKRRLVSKIDELEKQIKG